jgi:hypothetical protein
MTTPIIMWRLSWGEIKPVPCTKVTAGCVWPVERKGRRETRAGSWASYHETWADAHAAMLAKAERELDAARCRLERAQGDHGRIKGMEPPADAEVAP